MIINQEENLECVVKKGFGSKNEEFQYLTSEDNKGIKRLFK